MEPKSVDVDKFLVLKLIGPFATVLVLGILPFGADSTLKEVVVGLLCELGGGGDVVLKRSTLSQLLVRWVPCRPLQM